MKKIFTTIIFIIFISTLNAQWSSQSSGSSVALTGVSFTDGKIGTVVGENGTILRTTNGGTT